VTAAAPAARDVREGGTWSPLQRAKNGALYGVIVVALAFARVAPRSFVRLACRALGLLAFLVLPRARRRARARLVALGGPRPLAAFLRVGDLLADTIALLDPNERPARTLSLDARSRGVLGEAFEAGRGVVFLTAHLGPWERMAALLAAEGFPVATVARESYDPRLTRLYERLRAPRGVRSIYRGRSGAALAVVRELARGRAVGFLVDLPGRVPTLPVRFLGEDRAFPIGPARIALARGAAVVLGTATGADGANVSIERVDTSDLARGPRGERALLERAASALEARVRSDPAGWLGLLA
jgi:KDO2-lipid IV(A) lauroyltransferase